MQSSATWTSKALYVVFCLLLVLVAVADLRQAWLREEQVVRERVEETSYLIGEWVKGAFVASDYVLRDIISQVPVSELQYPHPDPVRQQEITDFINAKRLTVPFASSVGLTDANCIVTHTIAVLGFDASDREWCAVPRDNPSVESHVSPMFVSSNNEYMVIQARRFPGQQFVGTAGIGVNLEFFSEWIERVNIGRDGVLAIVDTDTQLLARKPTRPELLGQPMVNVGLEGFIGSGNDFTVNRSYSQLDGAKRLWGVRRVEGLPFVVIVGEADNTWLADWYQRVIRLSGVVLLFWLLGFLLLRKHLAVQRQQDELRALAQTDPLTGLANRRYFNDLAESERLRARRYEGSVGLLMLDIDNFKNINDSYGHAAGDAVIRQFTEACKSSLREIDSLARMGGDEFAALLPNIDEEGARLVAQRICSAIEQREFDIGAGRMIKLTTSIGGAVAQSDDETVDALMIRADAALYRAKRDGRNSAEF